MMNGTGTPMSSMRSLSLRRKSTRKVWSSTTTNCSGFSSEPAVIWKVGKPPTVTARSNDHFTSFAVTGVPSWNLASLRSLKVTDCRPRRSAQIRRAPARAWCSRNGVPLASSCRRSSAGRSSSTTARCRAGWSRRPGCPGSSAQVPEPQAACRRALAQRRLGDPQARGARSARGGKELTAVEPVRRHSDFCNLNGRDARSAETLQELYRPCRTAEKKAPANAGAKERVDDDR